MDPRLDLEGQVVQDHEVLVARDHVVELDADIVCAVHVVCHDQFPK